MYGVLRSKRDGGWEGSEDNIGDGEEWLKGFDPIGGC